MAKVIGGFMRGTSYGLTFYVMEGQLYVRMKSSLTGKRVKSSPLFRRTMQHAGELARASRVASRVYRELSAVQRRMVYVLYKKMTGVAKKAFSKGIDEAQAEQEVRKYLVEMGVVRREKPKVMLRKSLVVRRVVRRVYVVCVNDEKTGGNERKGRMVNVERWSEGPPSKVCSMEGQALEILISSE